MSAPVRLTVMGAGLIGKRHIEHILARPEAVLSSIVDPTPAARELAVSLNVNWFPSFQDLLSEHRPDGVVVATPNQMHVANGMDCIAAGIPALIEKPLADDVVAAQVLVEASERAGVPLLTGHHRRHNPMIQRAKDEIDRGRCCREARRDRSDPAPRRRGVSRDAIDRDGVYFTTASMRLTPGGTRPS